MIDLLLYVQEDESILYVRPSEVVRVGGDPYEGSYEVKPQFDRITLPTKDKVLVKDVEVEAIEVSRVSNPAGGKTVYIGGITNG